MKVINLAQDLQTSTIYYPEASNWDDLRFPLIGAQIDTSAGRIDYDFDECEVVFAANARYDEEAVCIVAQMQHAKRLGSIVSPHLHWIQDAETVPNWLIAYRWYNNGEAPGAFALAALTGHAFTYVSGDLAQITEFPNLKAPVGETVSSILDIKIFSDSGNESTLFDGAVALAGRAKELDLHYQIDSVGSGLEYVK